MLRLERRKAQVEADKQYREIGIYCFGRGVFHKPPRSGLEVGGKDLFLIRKGDFILQITFAWEGAVALMSQAEDRMYGSTRYPTFRVDEARCFPPFLANYFKTEEGLQQLIRISPGSAGRNRVLSLKRIPEVLVPLPPLQEQQRIVARIEELSSLIGEARVLRQQAVKDSEALLISMAHRADLDENDKNRMGWKEAFLHEVLHIVDDSHKVQPDCSYPNLGIFSFGKGLFTKQPINGVATSAKTLRRVKKGQFIYSRLFAFEGAFGMVTDEFDGFYVSNEYPTFECSTDKVRPEFLVSYFKSPKVWKELSAASKGLGDRRQRVQPDRVLALSTWLPPLSWQNRIADVHDMSETLKWSQSDSAAKMAALLPAILDRAFNGELL